MFRRPSGPIWQPKYFKQNIHRSLLGRTACVLHDQECSGEPACTNLICAMQMTSDRIKCLQYFTLSSSSCRDGEWTALVFSFFQAFGPSKSFCTTGHSDPFTHTHTHTVTHTKSYEREFTRLWTSVAGRVGLSVFPKDVSTCGQEENFCAVTQLPRGRTEWRRTQQIFLVWKHSNSAAILMVYFLLYLLRKHLFSLRFPILLKPMQKPIIWLWFPQW